MPEIETKYALEGELELPERFATDVGARTIAALEPLELKAAYYDTDDLRLARNGITLRHRTGDEGGDRWTVKVPAQVGRHEIEFQGPARTVPNEARELVRAFARGAPLKLRVTLKTKRRRWSFEGEDGRELAELVDDHVSVYKAGRVTDRWRELEVEARDGNVELIARVGTCLEALGARPTDGTPKAIRALGSSAAGPPDVAPVRSVPPSAPAAEAIRAAVASAAARLQTNDPRARLGDPEGIHQMRVAARHLRSDLRTFGSLVDAGWAKSVSHELKWIAGVLGEVRDLDVLSERLEESAADLGPAIAPLFGYLEERDAEARTRALDALGSVRYEKLLETLIEASKSAPVTETASEPSRRALPPLVAARWQNLRAAARAVEPHGDPAALHDVRILAKKARYAAEAAAIALPKKNARDATRFAELCSRVQDALGTQQDAVVAVSTIEEAVRANPGDVELHLASGRLIERQVRAGADATSQFERVWDKLDRKKNVAWMKRS